MPIKPSLLFVGISGGISIISIVVGYYIGKKQHLKKGKLVNDDIYDKFGIESTIGFSS
ncbi:MAG: hypothetical protein Edafosvirus7_29 [Edafosvirus sp.]|uniref:Uncharacterized protein n=1 Tax=Edafosvirus sp. TaxID=2487765 RepID=A0A3G4ZTM4_9VIRU|nr:MAG: hypothetical protein Edafosvirus7_29 [Edafosvirus sp.]